MQGPLCFPKKFPDFSSISDIFPRAKKRTFIALRELKYEAKSA